MRKIADAPFFSGGQDGILDFSKFILPVCLFFLFGLQSGSSNFHYSVVLGFRLLERFQLSDPTLFFPGFFFSHARKIFGHGVHFSSFQIRAFLFGAIRLGLLTDFLLFLRSRPFRL